MSSQTYYIQSPEQLREACEQLKQAQAVAVDTEFKREKTYFAQLCLIQVYDGQGIYCIDPLTLDNITPLLDLLYDSSIIKVMHAARQDLELFYDLRKEIPSPVFDTQIAATLLGYGDQVGYAKLVKAITGVSLGKHETRTDWSKRPLSNNQIRYAEDDVRYLLDIYQNLKNNLRAKDRLQWLQADFDKLTEARLYAPDYDNLWQKVKGVQTLPRQALVYIQALARWREQLALENNRPRRWLLSDDLLIELARAQPKDSERLGRVRGWGEKEQKYTATVLQVIAEANTVPQDLRPEWPQAAQFSASQESVLDVLLGIVKQIAAVNEVIAAILVTRKELEQLLAGRQDLPILEGWRYQLVGQVLQSFINAELEVFCQGGNDNCETLAWRRK